MTSANIENVARGYGVTLIDYARGSSGLLVCSGSGLMMSIMDHAPAIRWCCDYDCLDARAQKNIGDVLLWAERLCRPLVVAGWFDPPDPQPIRRALSALSGDNLHVYAGGGVRLVSYAQCETLSDLLRRLEQSKPPR